MFKKTRRDYEEQIARIQADKVIAAFETNALVLKKGDTVIVRNRHVTLSAEDAERVKTIFTSHGISAIAMGADWDVLRDNNPLLGSKP